MDAQSPSAGTPNPVNTPENLFPLHPGDRIHSTLAERPGEVVKTYPDGSACVRWDDGEPQEAGLGHERMPRKLLELDPQAAASVDKRKAYCRELLATLLRYADESEVRDTLAELEDMVYALSDRRPAPGLVAARYDLYRKFWLEGGAK